MFVVVDGKVFERSAYPHRFHALDVGAAHLAGEIGIFGKIFKVAAAQRRALDVDSGTEDDVDLLIDALFAQSDAHFADEIGIPARRHIDGRRECGGREGHLHAEAVVVLIFFAQAVRAVRHHERADAEAFDRLGRPKISAAAYRGFFAQSHVGNNFFDLRVGHSLFSQSACLSDRSDKSIIPFIPPLDKPQKRKSGTSVDIIRERARCVSQLRGNMLDFECAKAIKLEKAQGE